MPRPSLQMLPAELLLLQWADLESSSVQTTAERCHILQTRVMFST